MGIEIGVILGVSTGIGVLVLPSYLNTYRRWMVDGIKNPGVDLHNPVVGVESEVKGHLKFLIGQASRKIDILSPRLRATVWDKEMAQVLQRKLDQSPELKVRILTGVEIEGPDYSIAHPFHSALRNIPNRMALATLEGRFPFGAVRADDQMLGATSSVSYGELTPACTYYTDYDGYDLSRGAVSKFTRQFEELWVQADQRIPRVVPLVSFG